MTGQHNENVLSKKLLCEQQIKVILKKIWCRSFVGDDAEDLHTWLLPKESRKTSLLHLHVL